MPATTSTASALADYLRQTVFSARRTPQRIGAEIEFLSLDADTHAPVSVRNRLLPFLTHYADLQGWSLAPSAKGGPRFNLKHAGQIAIEPGGQLEYASPPFSSPATLLEDLHGVLGPLLDAARNDGIHFLGVGIDPHNSLDQTSLQIAAERYRCMDAYFASIGAAGQRMMRQTAAIQINVDAPDHEATSVDSLQRSWQVLNTAAPSLIALFANSRTYGGQDTGCASFRAETWRQADVTRTGIFACTDEPADEYAEFALGARDMFRRTPDGEYVPFQEWLQRGAGEERIETHLSTLFPEIRPRGFLEVRSIDASSLEWLAAPILLVAGLTADSAVLTEAEAGLGSPDPVLLQRAGRYGMKDPVLAETAVNLFEIALRSCLRRGSEWSGGENLEVARAFFDQFARRGRMLSDPPTTN
jgi:glutamate--cysteine ligase